jgi:hypothetical protein
MKVLSLDIGINNLSYCILSYADENYTIHSWDVLNVNPYIEYNKQLEKKKKKKKPTINELSAKIIKTFDDKKEFLECDYVIIENQPCMKNPIMKSIQMIVYSYFYIRGIVDKNREILKDIVFIAAGNKLKIYDGPPIEINVKSKYTRNKKLGIAHTQYILKNHEEYISFFESHKKKDDLADAFLQGAFYIHKKLGIN